MQPVARQSVYIQHNQFVDHMHMHQTAW
jgi:hypothetical protein